ncbi:LPS export ABC transporter permease LptF [Flexibacterium corallicola]|uniref:LPS export ABC transporter permease LptF n=1 Tax=Flexibacterium corallicola TaxID=3037259 RepID=UPI00286ED428|nr:LPS export ABC transporter permease LptF [Pseudovibrio sp. M1P-2-3]
MNTIERYILKPALSTFLLVAVVLVGIVWATQALRQLDLVTSKGQTLIQFGYITSLALPALAIYVSPFALAIALIIVLNRLARDSELIVISASGASRSIIMRPVIVFALLIAGFMAFLSIYLSPMSNATLRDEMTRVRADLIANIVKPGRFLSIGKDLIFHIRNRTGDGILEGLLLNDEREAETTFTYTAENGQIVEISGKTLLVMLDGTIQRRSKTNDDISIVAFESYGFDLTAMMPEAKQPVYKADERPTFELLSPSPDDSYAKKHPERLVVEFHDRLSAPLYPLAFGLIVYALMGVPKTTRQNQTMAIVFAIALCALVRTAGFGASLVVSTNPNMYWTLYGVPLLAIFLASWATVLSQPPSWATQTNEWLSHQVERLSSRKKSSNSHEGGA